MSLLEACRMCLSVDARMHIIADTALQHVYEKLTGIPLKSMDGKPATACYVCHHMLKKSRIFIERSLRADELLQQMLDHGLQLSLATIGALDSAHLKLSLAKSVTEAVFTGSPLPAPIRVEQEHGAVKMEGQLDEHEAGEVDHSADIELDQGTELADMLTLQPIKQENELTVDSEETSETMKIKVTVHGEMKPPGLRDALDDLIEEIEMKTNNGGNANQNVQFVVLCERCGAEFRSEQLLVDHTKLYHLKTVVQLSRLPNAAAADDGTHFQRDYFSETFNRKKKLIHHISAHETINTLNGIEPAEPQNWDQRRETKEDINRVDADERFRCNQCGKTLKRKKYLQAHITTHTREKPYRCGQCDKAFRTKPYLRLHMVTHTGGKSYRCDHCDKAFTTNHNLKRHIKGLTTGVESYRYRCSQCDKAYKRKENLIYHIKTHTGEKPHRCDQCHKAFKRKNCLKLHMSTHT